MNKILLASLGFALTTVGFNAYAVGKTQAAITPSLTITATCTIDTTAVNVAFPTASQGTAGAIALAPSNVVITCPKAAYAFGADIGVNSTVANQRDMKLGATANVIHYTLLAGGVALGDAGLAGVEPSYTETNTIAAITGVDGTAGGNAPIPYAITGAATLLGTEPAGAYSDTVTLTVAW